MFETIVILAKRLPDRQPFLESCICQYIFSAAQKKEHALTQRESDRHALSKEGNYKSDLLFYKVFAHIQ